MKKFPSLAVLLPVLLFALSLSCEIEDRSGPSAPFPRGSSLVINEVFTLPENHPRTFSWIEFYNPTSDTVNLTGWTITLHTDRFRDSLIVTLDTLGNFRSLRQFRFLGQRASYDVPFATGMAGIPGVPVEVFRVPPNGLFTVVDNESRLRDITRWGPGDQRLRTELPFFSVLDTVRILSVTDTLLTVNAILSTYTFFIAPKQQLVLKDPTGKVVDVVRMGDSVYSNVIRDSVYTSPLLSSSNRSIGTVPEFESIARYGGGYFTGNTASDFYITRPGLRPIPHWYSQLTKR